MLYSDWYDSDTFSEALSFLPSSSFILLFSLFRDIIFDFEDDCYSFFFSFHVLGFLALSLSVHVLLLGPGFSSDVGCCW